MRGKLHRKKVEKRGRQYSLRNRFQKIRATERAEKRAGLERELSGEWPAGRR